MKWGSGWRRKDRVDKGGDGSRGSLVKREERRESTRKRESAAAHVCKVQRINELSRPDKLERTGKGKSTQTGTYTVIQDGEGYRRPRNNRNRGGRCSNLQLPQIIDRDEGKYSIPWLKLIVALA